jgi:hypothetical protein
MLGLPEGLLREVEDSNPSLSMNACELVRRVNVRFRENKWPDLAYHHMIQRGAIKGAMYAPRPHDERIPPLPRWALERVAELSAQRISIIKSLGVRVVGDLDSLHTPVTESVSDAARDAPEIISIDQAEAAVYGAVEGALRMEAQLRKGHASTLKQEREMPRKRADNQSRARVKRQDRRVRDMSTKELLAVVRERIADRLRRLTHRS